ncbi:MAG: DUF2130 domain-containing protein [Candidatus Kapaibacterium sp.]
MNNIECPKCGYEFPVDEAISSKAEEKLKKDYEEKLKIHHDKLKAEKARLEEENKKIEESKKAQEELIAKRVQQEKKALLDNMEKEKAQLEDMLKRRNEEMMKRSEEERKSLYENLEQEKKQLQEMLDRQKDEMRKKSEEESRREKERLEKEFREMYSSEMETLKENFEKKKLEITALKKREMELLQKEADLREQKSNIELEMRRKMNEEREKLEDAMRRKMEEDNALTIKEYQKKLEDQKKLIEEMRRKSEQGSMQMQGEVQELALEEMLCAAFPFDRIEEVPKGVKGADCIQTVINSLQQSCGKIIYESKRTKKFNNEWIAKLKDDMRDQNADIAVIVTQTMPDGTERFCQLDDIWICGFHEAKSLAYVLRQLLIKATSVKVIADNKVSSQSLLYDYLTGNEFRGHVEAMVEGFKDMQDDLIKERNAMTKIWSKREKQMERVVANTLQMFGSIEGISGNKFKEIKALELPGSDEE